MNRFGNSYLVDLVEAVSKLEGIDVVEQERKVEKVEKVESTLCEWKHGTALNRNRNQQFKLFWRRYTRVINPCFLGFLQRASLGRALQVPSAPLHILV